MELTEVPVQMLNERGVLFKQRWACSNTIEIFVPFARFRENINQGPQRVFIEAPPSSQLDI